MLTLRLRPLPPRRYLSGNFDALNVLYESFPHHLLYNGV
jgi:hypothetical protein